MPPLQGFSNNSFLTHQDLKISCIALLRALKLYQSPYGARIKLPLSTGTHFDDIAAQLEGYARALWAIGTLLHSNTATPDEQKELLEPYARGLASGTNPQHPEYWGPVVERDQRMVEMEIISYALLAAPEFMFHAQTECAKRDITVWLQTINGKDFPATNWLWFRVMTNLALVRVCGVPYADVRGAMEQDLEMLEGFYLGEGWASDGVWGDEGRQADYYSGSFAIQFSQLVYAKMAQDLDPERCERFRNRARKFAVSFWRYFDASGAAIPFGRSLTYRFAFAGFWSAVAFADVQLPAPLNDWGVVKGLLLRHFRWWSSKHDIFNSDGTLTIGFTYPNMYMSEDYNSPQSPYWALKSYLALGLPATHPFWTAEEKPLPQTKHDLAVPVKPPMHILCNTGNHHFLLSAGQFCPWPLKATEAKYGKYAYSSHFGFSVPTGPLIQQSAPDSTLALSKDGGDTWRVPWKARSPQFGEAHLWREGKVIESIPTLSCTWTPWVDADISVHTLLVAPCTRWPNHYVRVHTITNHGSSPVPIKAVQGGFAIQARSATRGEALPAYETPQSLTAKDVPEGTLQTRDGVLVCSDAGSSGIRSLSTFRSAAAGVTPEEIKIQPHILKPDANTNLIHQRTLIPTLNLHVTVSSSSSEVSFACAVFGLGRTSESETRYAALDIAELWNDIPVIAASAWEPEGECIVIE
ncbi:hypothetical protein P153DRAFT_338609 [Dothidotthia symphoricarpi CBS 119687]|uniref:Uncharacterized protein n=1 Tax=Dothidotthia symphoricarpi CBS 119687 TaxID=1392245 RepID=A0A6A6AHP9_9PLEO|nr:uncharacterized protein P153DRAFT_338609 [Dothidotthia symphoricarpi CBS 119687]KAF2130618.1 hypothetical protein P153DRAFT_338609 [Dothidotthia symphoricarpi CBS 119687]